MGQPRRWIMRTNRRGFIRLLGLGAAGAGCVHPLAAWADKIRILGNGKTPDQTPFAAEKVSPDFRALVAGVRVGETRAQGGLRVVWLFTDAPAAVLAVAALE